MYVSVCLSVCLSVCMCVCVYIGFVIFYIPCQERALDYLSTCIDQVHTFNDILQLVIVELVYKVLCMCDNIYYIILLALIKLCISFIFYSYCAGVP